MKHLFSILLLLIAGISFAQGPPIPPLIRPDTNNVIAPVNIAYGTQTNGYVVKLVAGKPTWQRDSTNSGVPTSRTITINGTTQDLTADRSFTISGGSGAVSAVTTAGTSGPATLVSGTLNIPQYVTGSAGVAPRYYANAYNYLNFDWQPATTKTFGDAIVDADCDSVLFIKSGSTYYRHVYTGYADARWWGVIPDDGLDDYAALQKAVNACIKNRIGDLLLIGTVELSKGVLIRTPLAWDGNGSRPQNASLMIHGLGPTYDPFLNGCAQVKLADGQEGAFYFQYCKGGGCENIYFIGQNTGLAAYTDNQIYQNYNSMITNGVANYATAPHAGIVVDPAYSSGVAHKYPSITSFYTGSSIKGSTGLTFRNCSFTYFAVGICISPAGTQNGEHILIDRPSFTYVSSSIATCDIQNRTVSVVGYMGWQCIGIHSNSVDYGPGGQAMPPSFHVFNIAGATRELCRVSNYYGNVITWEDGHWEIMRGFGGCYQGKGGTVSFRNVEMYMKGHTDGDTTILNPITMGQADKFIFDNCILTYYGVPQSLFKFRANHVVFRDCSLSSPALVYNGIVKYEGITTFEEFNLMPEKLDVALSTNQNITISAVNKTAKTWTFTDAQSIPVGAYMILVPKNSSDFFDEFSNSYEQVPAGRVVSRSGTTVTVSAPPNKMTVGMNVDAISWKYTVHTP